MIFQYGLYFISAHLFPNPNKVFFLIKKADSIFFLQGFQKFLSFLHATLKYLETYYKGLSHNIETSQLKSVLWIKRVVFIWLEDNAKWCK